MANIFQKKNLLIQNFIFFQTGYLSRRRIIKLLKDFRERDDNLYVKDPLECKKFKISKMYIKIIKYFCFRACN